MTRIAVIGSTGQLGNDLVAAIRHTDDADVIPLSHSDIEVTDETSVRSVLTAARPDIVVNCAAMVRVDDCEDHPEEAFRVNTLGALHVARACAALGAACVYISTDYVFDGTKPTPYTEEDQPHPINAYGISKLAGEEAVRAYNSAHLIVRSSGLYGRGPARGKRNFINAMVRLAHRGEQIRVVDDQVVSPTYTVDAASAIVNLVRAGARGVYHICNTGQCSWYEFAREIFLLLGLQPDLTPVTSAEFGARARRPHNSALSTTRPRRTPTSSLRPWPDALASFLTHQRT